MYIILAFNIQLYECEKNVLLSNWGTRLTGTAYRHMAISLNLHGFTDLIIARKLYDQGVISLNVAAEGIQAHYGYVYWYINMCTEDVCVCVCAFSYVLDTELWISTYLALPHAFHKWPLFVVCVQMVNGSVSMIKIC